MIRKDGVVQHKIMISVCPVVTDVGVFLDDQIGNSKSV